MTCSLKRFFLTVALFIMAVSFLVACSDGSSSDSGVSSDSDPSVQGDLIAHVSELKRSVPSGQVVSLHAFATNTNGDVSYFWEQLAGPEVVLIGADTANASFTAPTLKLEKVKRVYFQVTATDDTGSDASPEIEIAIQPPPDDPNQTEDNLILQALTESRKVLAGNQVSLHAQATGGNIATFSWRQVSPPSPQVTLNGADTANPTFIAPDVKNVPYVFEVVYADNLREETARVQVDVYQPGQHASLQPLGVEGSNVVPPKQAMQIGAQPVPTAISGQEVRLHLIVTGGEQPYSWQWAQNEGTTASISGQTDAVLVITAPSVSAPEFLVFEAVVTDNLGSTLTGNAHVRVLPTLPSGGSGSGVSDSQTLSTIDVSAGTPIDISTSLTNPQVTQIAGSVGSLQTRTGADGSTTITFTPPVIASDSEPAELSIIGTDTNGQLVQQVVPLRVLRAPSLPVEPKPPLVEAKEPTLFPDLTVTLCGSGYVNEGQVDVPLCATATGGDGTYTYNWVYDRLPGSNSPVNVDLRNADTSHPVFDAPANDLANSLIALQFMLTVTSGNQVVEKTALVAVRDLSSTLVATISDLTVESGHDVTLSAPKATGGVPPYQWTVIQTSGTNVGALTGDNPTFTAPTLTAGDPDEVLQFLWTLTDDVGNVADVQELVTVTAPPPPLVANLDGPASVNQGEEVALHATVNGGLPPYSYTYRVIDTLAGGDYPGLTVPENANPVFNAPVLQPGDDPLKLVVTLTATDSSGVSARAPNDLEVVAPAAPLPTVQSAAEQFASALAALPADQQTLDGIKDVLRTQFPPGAGGFDEALLGKLHLAADGSISYSACEDIYSGGAAACDAAFNGRCGEFLVQQLCASYCGTCDSLAPEWGKIYAEYIHDRVCDYPATYIPLYEKIYGSTPTCP